MRVKSVYLRQAQAQGHSCHIIDVFMPNFPSPALVLVTGIAKHIFQSFGVVNSKNMLGQGVHQYVIKMENLIKSHLVNELLQVPMGRQLKQILNLGHGSVDGIPVEDASIPQIDMDLITSLVLGCNRLPWRTGMQLWEI